MALFSSGVVDYSFICFNTDSQRYNWLFQIRLYGQAIFLCPSRIIQFRLFRWIILKKAFLRLFITRIRCKDHCFVASRWQNLSYYRFQAHFSAFPPLQNEEDPLIQNVLVLLSASYACFFQP